MGKVLSASISQGGNFAHHQIISCQIALPRIPRIATVSRERVALFLLWANPNYTSLLKVARVAVAERGADIVLEDVARSAGVAIGTLYRHFPTRQDLLEAVFLDEINELKTRAEELASAPVPFDALIDWFRLQLDFAARGRSMGAAMMAAKQVPGTRSYTTNRALFAAGEVLLLRAQAAKQIRTDVNSTEFYTYPGPTSTPERLLIVILTCVCICKRVTIRHHILHRELISLVF